MRFECQQWKGASVVEFTYYTRYSKSEKIPICPLLGVTIRGSSRNGLCNRNYGSKLVLGKWGGNLVGVAQEGKGAQLGRAE